MRVKNKEQLILLFAFLYFQLNIKSDNFPKCAHSLKLCPSAPQRSSTLRTLHAFYQSKGTYPSTHTHTLKRERERAVLDSAQFQILQFKISYGFSI